MESSLEKSNNIIALAYAAERKLAEVQEFLGLNAGQIEYSFKRFSDELGRYVFQDEPIDIAVTKLACMTFMQCSDVGITCTSIVKGNQEVEHIFSYNNQNWRCYEPVNDKDRELSPWSTGLKRRNFLDKFHAFFGGDVMPQAWERFMLSEEVVAENINTVVEQLNFQTGVFSKDKSIGVCQGEIFRSCSPSQGIYLNVYIRRKGLSFDYIISVFKQGDNHEPKLYLCAENDAVEFFGNRVVELTGFGEIGPVQQETLNWILHNGVASYKQGIAREIHQLFVFKNMPRLSPKEGRE